MGGGRKGYRLRCWEGLVRRVEWGAEPSSQILYTGIWLYECCKEQSLFSTLLLIYQPLAPWILEFKCGDEQTAAWTPSDRTERQKETARKQMQGEEAAQRLDLPKATGLPDIWNTVSLTICSWQLRSAAWRDQRKPDNPRLLLSRRDAIVLSQRAIADPESCWKELLQHP